MRTGTPKVSRTALLAATWLAVFAMAGVGMVALTHLYTQDQTRENERNRLIRSVNEVLSDARYDNDPVSDYLDLYDPELLPPKGETRVYRAFKAGKPVAAVFPITAPDGYNGAIHLLMAVNLDGSISGVRVLRHKETPGLGDEIERAKSHWITHFTGKNLRQPNESGWKVKKDGGEFDQFTGATITPRAVVMTVHRGIRLFHKHRRTLFPDTSPRS